MGTNPYDLTTTQGTGTGAEVEESLVPLLTILGHPQAQRIGELVWLEALQAPGGTVRLSRADALFHPPAGGQAAPLRSPLISRRPITLRRELAGDLSVDPGELAGKIFVDGEAIRTRARIASERLDAGVVLRVGRHAVFVLHRRPRASFGPPLRMIGHSHCIEVLRERTLQLAGAAGGVLIRGETGTGKELVAAALHEASGRNGPFVAVNLGAIPSALAASELFGHARGAFTGAGGARDGYFLQANGGTLFLDEVGDAPDDVQLALLRALETSSIQPLGASRPVEVDVRIVAATDAPLEEHIAEGKLRAPFFHRLATHVLHVPSLRERRDDIGRLLVHFLRADLAAIGAEDLLDPAPRDEKAWLSAKVIERVALAPWTGNVRQLRNVARYLAGRAGGSLRADDPDLTRLLGLSRAPNDPTASAPASRRPSEISDGELASVLESVDWELGRAAAHFGVSRAALNGRVDAHRDLRRAKFLGDEEIEVARAEAEASGLPLWRVLRVSRRGLARRLSSVDRA